MTRDDIHRRCRKHKYSHTYEIHWMDHRNCSIRDCACWAEAPHHIRTRGAGGDDEPINLLSLCMEHHIEVHASGVKTFALEHSELRDQIQAALERPREVE